MVQVAPVRLQYNPKVLWFDPQGLELSQGDAVIVKTERGTEFGTSLDLLEVSEDDIEALKSPLKPVLRKAEARDFIQLEELRQKSMDALPIFKRLAAELHDNMRPIMVEYLFGGDKAIFFFESEERIDFRELVRQLANELGIRVDMRQIGVRDEARMVGGLGHCGQELCCKRLGGEFNPVSIRMAKEQDLSLNPAKISGICGRLMCCLRYEFDAYKDYKSRAPKINADIDTPCGMCKVCDLDVPRETVTVLMEDDEGKKNKRVTFPLAAMDPVEEGERPNSIGDVFEEYANPDPFASTTFTTFDTASFTREDKVAEPVAHHHGASQQDEEKPSHSRRRRRRRGGKKTDTQAQQQGQAKKQESSGSADKRKRRRRGSHQSGAAQANNTTAQTSSVRPGQKSSSLNRQNAAKPKRQQVGETSHRKARRRSHKTDSGQA